MLASVRGAGERARDARQMAEVELLDAALRSAAARSEVAAMREGFDPAMVEKVSEPLDMRRVALVQPAKPEPANLEEAFSVELVAERVFRGLSPAECAASVSG